ncbi:class I SAM-dependent methyltransferase [Nonomuraea terrae]|uniref:Class I SAM-dependent methyltransferase n=1 Tax=Nonomuraea terrae TaxID=2530383 RepID=A0A4R4XMK2_9ACTN|nr:class I SAM-dependent methyltransferase [Nonomuraea terrae]TDD32286.1 class I SAM-dependent methyltransferase [Nonomuraea terrae]
MTDPKTPARGWDDAADGYDAYFVPRFARWVTAAVRAVTVVPVPDGPILVPCCGTFPELDLLAEQFPGREIVGIDLSAGMVRRAQRRAGRWPNARVVEGDAATLDACWSGRCAAVVSVFGLQQLPRPDLALRSWVAALRPAGRLSVVFWPDVTEPDGPFTLIDEVVRAHVPAGDNSWEDRLVAASAAQGATVEQDEQLSYPITHPDAPTFFDAYTRSGPLRGLANARGDAFISRLRAEFLRRAPTGELNHRPSARLITAHR